MGEDNCLAVFPNAQLAPANHLYCCVQPIWLAKQSIGCLAQGAFQDRAAGGCF